MEGQVAGLPRPERILVFDPAVTPAEVSAPPGLGPSALDAFHEPPSSERDVERRREVAAHLAAELVAGLRQLGLPAERSPRRTPLPVHALLMESALFCVERLMQEYKDMLCELQPPTQAQVAVVRQEHLPRHGPLAATDHAHIGDGVVRAAERARGDDGGTPAGQAGDAMDAGGLEGFREGQRRQDVGSHAGHGEAKALPQAAQTWAPSRFSC
jgi:hypothetical protein